MKEKTRPIGHYQVVKYAHNWCHKKEGGKENMGVEKIFETIMAKNFPNVSKTINANIKKPINLKQKKYKENHTKSQHNQIAKHQC